MIDDNKNSQPTQAVDVGAIREVVESMYGWMNDYDTPDARCARDAWALKLTRAISGEKAGRVSDGVFYIDCEFDGHNGPLLSMALVAQDGRSVHIKTDAVARDPWVIANVVPLIDKHHAQVQVVTPGNGVGEAIRSLLGDCSSPEIVADSPVDIARFCTALSTDAEGQWASADYPRMTFLVENVDCYPTILVDAVQHNAWWDAMALRQKLSPASPTPDKQP